MTGTAPVVGVVGAAGAVGSVAVTELHRRGRHTLRLAGRRRAPLDALAGGLTATGSAPTVEVVDLDDADALHRFCAGCDVVLNCAGPAYLVEDRVARVALAAGADYVDAAGDDVLWEQVRALLAGAPERTAVISAGMMPGLSALLPRHLAAALPQPPRALLGYLGGRDRFTATAAADYLRVGEGFGQAGAALTAGVRQSLPTRTDVELPFFPEPATAVPYLSTELERVTRDLGVTDATWHSVFAGPHVAQVLRQPPTGGDAAEALRRAAELDAFGQATYQLFVVELTTAAGDARTLVLRGASASALTGAFAAVAVAALTGGNLAVGLHLAGEALDPQLAVDLLAGSAAVSDLSVFDGEAAHVGGHVEEAL
ncbi:saccharopine dehydrogenase NADP-binding domain-containing protein [Verrucosispora sp. FIM060022]|uniref:saccharopine dehydrogenase NADP-binding domain-containing protein n=1 Tax=Verrucosispora sp. FIM060022 TaxID=1479020 RepID=UPI00256F2F59|nr:saccharopine dehydrogenase NADP-binding domain-containing protein [Verrucosispora sp. FIM060022]